MTYKGDFTPGKTVRFHFNTTAKDQTPITLSGGTLGAIKDGGTITAAAGLTLTVDVTVGLHLVTVSSFADATFWSAGSDFTIILTAGTVDGVSVAGHIVGMFSLNNRSALRPTTPDRTLDVSASGGLTGSVGSVTGNVGGNVVGSVASVTGNVGGNVVGNVQGNVNGSVGSVLGSVSVTGLNASLLDVAVSTRLAAADYVPPPATTTPPTAVEIADAVLSRDMALVPDTTPRSPLNALRFLRNKWYTSPETDPQPLLTVTKEDDTTVAWTSVLATNAGAQPVTASDPA